MEIHVYGKKDCELCKSAKRKTEVFLEKWNKTGLYPVKLIDLETVDGAADGDYFDVFDVPSVFVMADEWTIAGRWDGQAPPSHELRSVLENAA